MATHPVQMHVETPERMARVHVLIRLVLLMALGAVGGSSLYWILYLALPAVAALLIASKGAERYHAEDAPGIARALGWLAGAYAYLWLLTDRVPGTGSVGLEVEPAGAPTAGAALLRLLTSLPALIVLAVLSMVGCLLWLIGALSILIVQRVPRAIAGFLALTLRYQFRLVAYHLSLVDRYPSFEEAALTQVRAA